VAAVTALCCFAACGEDERRPVSGDERRTVVAAEPPADCRVPTQPETIRDLVTPAPRGYEVLRLNRVGRREVERLLAPMRRSLGDSWRGFEARLLLRRGTRTGAIVTVMDGSAMSGGAVDFLAGAEAGGRRWGKRVERIRIAGAAGRLSAWPDGGTTAMAVTDRCAVVMVFGDAPAPVRRAARALPAS
jgi:hypothetical protein